MKKMLLLSAALLALGMMTACKNGASGEAVAEGSQDTINDTLWADDHGYWEIKTPFEEEGRTVLYRSCVLAGQEDGIDNEIELSYYLLHRGTAAYDSSLRMMQAITSKDYTEGFVEASGMAFSPIHVGDVPRHWYPVCKYKGEYYLYQECACGLYLSDGAIIPSCGDFYPYQLKSVEALPDGSYRFQYEVGSAVDTVEMNLVDKKRGLYRYTDTNFLQLFTIDSHLRDYDLIKVDGSTLMGIDGIEIDYE